MTRDLAQVIVPSSWLQYTLRVGVLMWKPDLGRDNNATVGVVLTLNFETTVVLF